MHPPKNCYRSINKNPSFETLSNRCKAEMMSATKASTRIKPQTTISVILTVAVALPDGKDGWANRNFNVRLSGFAAQSPRAVFMAMVRAIKAVSRFPSCVS